MDVVAIRTEGLTKRFGSFTALDSLDLEIPCGEVFGFLGPNGAGKSTTLRLLLAFIAPTAGSASILGIDVADVRAAHQHVAYVPGDVNLWPKLTGAECLDLFANLHGATDRAYRDELVDRFELDTRKRARTYSKGNRQKVALVSAFATRAEVLLLDEPTSGLDPLMEQQFRTCVAEAQERGVTVFLSSHILTEVEQLCSRVGILRDGALVEVATLDRLRALHSTAFEIDLAEGDRGSVPDLRGVEGVVGIDATPAGLRIAHTGPPGPLLRAIDGLPITALRSEDASLEEIFLTYYGSKGETGETGAAVTTGA